jgi:hypothetical protein
VTSNSPSRPKDATHHGKHHTFLWQKAQHHLLSTLVAHPIALFLANKQDVGIRQQPIRRFNLPAP